MLNSMKMAEGRLLTNELLCPQNKFSLNLECYCQFYRKHLFLADMEKQSVFSKKNKDTLCFFFFNLWYKCTGYGDINALK